MKKILGFVTALLLLFGSSQSFAVSGGDQPTSGPGYLELSPPFTVNVNDGDRLRFLQVQVQFKLSDVKISEKLLHHDSIIRHTMLMLLSGQEANDLYSATGKERLRKQALNEVLEALKPELEQPLIEDMYFTNFIIQ